MTLYELSGRSLKSIGLLSMEFYLQRTLCWLTLRRYANVEQHVSTVSVSLACSQLAVRHAHLVIKRPTGAYTLKRIVEITFVCVFQYLHFHFISFISNFWDMTVKRLFVLCIGWISERES